MAQKSDMSDALVYPTSHAQQRMWLAEQIGGNPSAYVLVDVLEMQGPLEVDALVDAFAALVARHESLRTTIHLLGSHLVQAVWPNADLPLLRDQARTPEADLDAIGIEEAARPFDVAAGPMLRARLIQYSEEHHLLVLAMHHLISDGWSLGVFSRELSALYGAAVRGEVAALAPPTIQYRDYAIWQRRRAGKGAAKDLAYWQEHLSGAPASITWRHGLDRARSTQQEGARIPLFIDPASAGRMRKAAREASCTEFMWLLAAYAAAIGRHTDDRDVVIGVPVANRTSPDLEGLIGFLVNMLPLRVPTTDGFDLTVLPTARDAALGGLAHNELPFDALVRHLQPPRDRLAHPVFQVALAFQNVPPARWDVETLDVRTCSASTGAAMYEATLCLEPRGDGYAGYLEHDVSVIPSSVAEDMAAQIELCAAA